MFDAVVWWFVVGWTGVFLGLYNIVNLGFGFGCGLPRLAGWGAVLSLLFGCVLCCRRLFGWLFQGWWDSLVVVFVDVWIVVEVLGFGFRV